jgi:hypothetical protein
MRDTLPTEHENPDVETGGLGPSSPTEPTAMPGATPVMGPDVH